MSDLKRLTSDRAAPPWVCRAASFTQQKRRETGTWYPGIADVLEERSGRKTMRRPKEVKPLRHHASVAMFSGLALALSVWAGTSDAQIRSAFPKGPGLGDSVCSITPGSTGAFDASALNWSNDAAGGTSGAASIDNLDLIASATGPVFAGLDAQINQFDINISRASILRSYDPARYIQYSFTTTPFSGLAEIYGAAMAGYALGDPSDDRSSGVYTAAILIDDDAGFGSPDVLLADTRIANGDFFPSADSVLGPQDLGTTLYSL